MAYQPFPEFDAWELQFIQDVPYAALFEEEARKNNVSALLLVSMTQQESSWVEDVEGPPIYIKGEDGIIRYYGKATGLMQIMPDAWRDTRARMGKSDELELRKNPLENIPTGAKYLGWLRDVMSTPSNYPGLPQSNQATLTNVLAAYNGGIGNVTKSLYAGHQRGLTVNDAEYGVPDWLPESQLYAQLVPQHAWNFVNLHMPEGSGGYRPREEGPRISKGAEVQGEAMAWPTLDVVYGANLPGAEAEPRGIVLHHTGSPETSATPAPGWVESEEFAANIFISRAGTVMYSGYPIGAFTPHTGTVYGNMYTVGIEIENSGLGEEYSDEQVRAVVETIRGLRQDYPSIVPEQIVPHGALNHVKRIEHGTSPEGYVIGAKMPCEPCGLNVRALVEFAVGGEDIEVATAVMFEDPETENVSAFPAFEIVRDFHTAGVGPDEATPIFEAGQPTDTATPAVTPTPTDTPSPTVTPTGLWTMTPVPTDTATPTDTAIPTVTATPTVTPSPTATLFTVPDATAIPTPTPTSADMGMILRGTPTATWTPEVIITSPPDNYEEEYWHEYFQGGMVPPDGFATAIIPDITSTPVETASSTVAPITSTATSTATPTTTPTTTQVATGTTAPTATQVPTATPLPTGTTETKYTVNPLGREFARKWREKHGTPVP